MMVRMLFSDKRLPILHHGRENTQDRPIDQTMELVFDFLDIYLVALQTGGDVVIVKRFANARIEKQKIALEMQVETAEVHVGGTDDAVFVITDNTLRMDKSGRIAVDLNTFFYKLRVKSFGNGKDVFFIGDMRDRDAHVHSRARGGDQSALHFSVENKVGSVNVNVFFCIVDYFQVQIFAYVGVLPVGGVAESDTGTISLWLVGEVFLEIFVFVAQRPKLQKHGAEILYNASAYHDAGIFPMSERMCFVDIFVSEVDTAGKSGFAVDDCNFAVGAVILCDIQNGAEGIETHTFDAAFFKSFRVISGYFEHGADVVVNEADIDAVFRFIFQDLENAVEKFPRLYNEIFQENIFFGFFKFSQQLRCVSFSGGEVLKIRAVGKRHAGMNGNIFGALSGKVVVLNEPIVRIVFFCVCIEAFCTTETGGQDQPSPTRELMPPQHDIEQNSDRGQKQNREDPCDFILCVHIEIDDINGSNGVNDGEHN